MIELIQKVKSSSQYKLWAIGFIWLVHVTGMIGISIGYTDWFMSKTALNLLLLNVLLVIFYPIDNLKVITAFVVMFIIGFGSEWLGVNYGLIFGDYHYGDNLGIKIGGVPILIGINWALLTLISGAIVSHFFKDRIVRIILASALMLLLDISLEHTAPTFDFWYWDLGYPPLQNYIGWFGVAFVLQILYQTLKLKGDLTISVHLYTAQLVFFSYFYGFYHL